MKKHLSIHCQLMDQKREMSKEDQLKLLEKQREIIGSILTQLEEEMETKIEEKGKLKEDIAELQIELEDYTVSRIKVEGKIDRRRCPRFLDVSSSEEQEEEEGEEESSESS